MNQKTERWQRLCEAIKEDDGLRVRDSGYWAENKLFYWNRYVEITTTAMVGNSSWPNGVSYVDLFSGPGVCRIEKTGVRFPGSPLIAANSPKPFNKILLCEIDEETAHACETRMAQTPAADSFTLFRGDCNKNIQDVVAALPRRSLTLAFLDPTGLHLKLETVRTLSSHGPVDLLILFPDAVDILRNVQHTYFEKPESNLDQVLGFDSKWRERVADLTTADAATKRRLFADIYKEQLAAVAGYNHFGEKVINGPSGPLYRLVYATKHDRGLDFWNKSILKEASGQKRLF